LRNVIDVSKGGDFTFVKTSDNEIYAFGNNRYSQLGIETKDIFQTKPIKVLQGKEDIWNSKQISESFLKKWRAKSARKM